VIRHPENNNKGVLLLLSLLLRWKNNSHKILKRTKKANVES